MALKNISTYSNCFMVFASPAQKCDSLMKECKEKCFNRLRGPVLALRKKQLSYHCETLRQEVSKTSSA